MKQNIFLLECFKIIYYLYQLKNTFSGNNQIESWKSNGMSEGSIESITKSDNILVPTKFITSLDF